MARNRKRQERADYRAGGRVAFQRGGPRGGKATTKSSSTKKDAPKFNMQKHWKKYNAALKALRQKGVTITDEKVANIKAYIVDNPNDSGDQAGMRVVRGWTADPAKKKRDAKLKKDVADSKAAQEKQRLDQIQKERDEKAEEKRLKEEAIKAAAEKRAADKAAAEAEARVQAAADE